MKVFVTGGTGLVGSFVIKELIARGYETVVLIRDKSKPQLINPKCELVEGDIMDILSLQRGMANCQMVVHCAGLVSFDPKKSDLIYQTNVEGTANMVNVSLQLGIQKFVHLSSIAALGRQLNRLEMTEASEWIDSPLNSTYAKSKYLAELEVFRAGEEGLSFTIVNPSVILGPGDLNRSSTKLFDHIRRQPNLYPKGRLNVVDVRDVASTIVNLLQVDHRDRLILNWGSLSYKEFYALIRQELAIQGPLLSIPRAILVIIAYFSLLKSLFVSGEPIMTKENLRFLSKKFEYHSRYFHELFPQARLCSPKGSITWTVAQLFGQK